MKLNYNDGLFTIGHPIILEPPVAKEVINAKYLGHRLPSAGKDSYHIFARWVEVKKDSEKSEIVVEYITLSSREIWLAGSDMSRLLIKRGETLVSQLLRDGFGHERDRTNYSLAIGVLEPQPKSAEQFKFN